MERRPVFNRMKLVELVEKHDVSVAEAARQCGMSRQKAHKWLARHQSGGDAALEDASRARRETQRLEGPVAEALVRARVEHPTWGARKLVHWLERNTREEQVPAPSTVGELLKRRGLITARKRVRNHQPFRFAGPTPTMPNVRWTEDFKGQFRLRDGTMCYPFTLRDAASRKVLAIQALPSTHGEPVRAVLEKRMREFGLPEEIQSDGGSPFATRGLARLSTLSVWLMKLGISPVLSRPGKPQDNGAHERMHRDLKAETTRPPATTMSGQQRRFDRFIDIYNTERPHQALDGDCPEDHWRRSPREFPQRIAAPEYPAWWERRMVNGRSFTISWRNQPVKVNDALANETLGFEPYDDGKYRVHFYGFVIGHFDERASGLHLTSAERPAGRLPI
jgi:transposase InsO family protein